MPLHTTDIEGVDRFETATILAALRLLQAAPALPSEIIESVTDCGAFERLDDAQVRDLASDRSGILSDVWLVDAVSIRTDEPNGRALLRRERNRAAAIGAAGAMMEDAQ